MGLNIGLYLRRSERTDTEIRSIGTEVRRIGTDFRPRRNKGGGLSHSPRHDDSTLPCSAFKRP
jgi:hypothetical protein